MSILQNLTTDRLILRSWESSDLDPLAEMMADPLYNRFMPGPFPRIEAEKRFRKIQSQIDETGFGTWVVELPEKASFIGFVGLAIPRHQLPCSPCVEIGWHFQPRYWGMGYATEAAREVLRWGFVEKKLDEIVAFTVPENLPSISIMDKLGMIYDPSGDFAHPALPQDHRLSHHILYRKKNPDG